MMCYWLKMWVCMAARDQLWGNGVQSQIKGARSNFGTLSSQCNCYNHLNNIYKFRSIMEGEKEIYTHSLCCSSEIFLCLAGLDVSGSWERWKKEKDHKKGKLQVFWREKGYPQKMLGSLKHGNCSHNWDAQEKSLFPPKVRGERTLQLAAESRRCHAGWVATALSPPLP